MASSTQLYTESEECLYPITLTSLVINHDGKILENRLKILEKMLDWFELDEESNLIKAKLGLYSVGSLTAGGKRESAENSNAKYLAALKDVNIANALDGQILVYDSASGMWVNGTISAGGGNVVSTLNGLTDVTITNPSDGQALIYHSGKWINKTIETVSTEVPIASSTQRGGVKIGYSGAGTSGSHYNIPVELSSEKAFVKMTKTMVATALGYTPMNQADFTGDNIVQKLGYTPFDAAAFTKANIKSKLGISDWALASSKPSYSWSEIGSRPTALSQFTNDLGLGMLAYKGTLAFSELTNKPTTLAGYGIADAYTITQIETRFNNTVIYSNYIDITNNDAARHIGYGYASIGWHGSGPAMSFGVAAYNLRMQLAIEASDAPRIMVSQVCNSTAYGWAELVTYEGAKGKDFEALRYKIGETYVLNRSGNDTFLNYGNRTTGSLSLYGTSLYFSLNASSVPFKILADGKVHIAEVPLTKGTSNSLKAAAYEALNYFADGKLIMHRNEGAANFYLNYGGASEPMYLYGSMYGFHIGASRERAFTIDSNKDASFVGELSVAGNSYSKNYPGGKAFSQDPTSAFISTIFDADAVSDSSYRMKILRSGLAYDRFNAAYSPVVAFKTGDTHGFISFGYNSANKDKCYIGAGNGDAVNWSGVLFHDNMHLIPKDDGAFLLGYNSNRWSALHAVSVFTDNIYGNVPTGGTYQRYRLVSSGDRMYLQVGAQDGTATAGKLTISGINVSALLDLEIVSQSTLFTGDTQVNGTSRFVSLATFDKGLKIGDATLSWDSAAGMLKADKGFYSTGAITAGGKGNSNLGGPVMIDLPAIMGKSSMTDAQAAAVGLTDAVIANLVAGKYTKIVCNNNGTDEVWNYSGRKGTSLTHLFFTKGDVFDYLEAITMYRGSSGTWEIRYNEI